jgi:hypothetical protein
MVMNAELRRVGKLGVAYFEVIVEELSKWSEDHSQDCWCQISDSNSRIHEYEREVVTTKNDILFGRESTRRITNCWT